MTRYFAVCSSVHGERTQTQWGEEGEAATKQNKKLLLLICPKWQRAIWDNTLPVTAQVNRNETYWCKHAIWKHSFSISFDCTLFVENVVCSPAFFPPTLDCIVELQLLDWSGQNVERHSFFKVQFTQNREGKHQHTTSGYKDLVCFDTKVRERGKWDPGEHIKAEKIKDLSWKKVDKTGQMRTREERLPQTK